MSLVSTAVSARTDRAQGRGVRIAQWTPAAIDAVRAFNARLRAGGVRYQFPETPPAHPAASPVEQEHYLAIDGGGTMRGGYIIKQQQYAVRGIARRVGFYRLPLSEGLLDPRYGAIGVQLLADALKRQPQLFVLGVGGFDEPLARMVVGLGWRLKAIPLFFRVEQPFRFARGMRHLRRTRAARLVLDALAWSGAASAAGVVLRAATRRASGDASRRLVTRFDAAADEVWRQCRDGHVLIGARDAATLNALYPPDQPRWIRLEVCQAGRPVGWAVLLDTQMADNAYFGSLRVGSIVDCLAPRDAAPSVIGHAAAHLRQRGVDVIVSNQSSAGWGTALQRHGFHRRSSGFLFGAAPALAAQLAPSELAEFHLTRGDGDGPIHL